MFKWLSKYIRRIDVMGVGIELREQPDIPPAPEKVPPQPRVGSSQPAQFFAAP